MTTDAFTAWSTCPACGRFECHSIRPPCSVPALKAAREAKYEVIRTCKCGMEFGQV
jgi:hypothetical protein